MDERRFDQLSRAIARTGTRRAIARGVIAAVASALGVRAAAGLTAPSAAGCLELGERCRPDRGRPCCRGSCSDRYRCACPPDNPDCDQPEPTATAESTVVADAAEFSAVEPLCPSGCPPQHRCLTGVCCPPERIYVECQSEDICQPDDSLRCCVGPNEGPERCCPLDLICGDYCCRDDQTCEEGECVGGVQYVGGVWLRRP
jgi:hypothetical protein